MQIVIELPDREAEYLMNTSYIGGRLIPMIHEALKTGTPLPKGYGRLINADDVYDALSPYVSFSDLYDALNEIPTIVEADKEE